ncbi:MAG: hypothetical protein ABIO65_07155, partial [Nitrospiria bacterium]
ETLAELHLVKGITDEVYRAVAPYLTVYRNGATDPLNVNTADPLVLQTLPVKEGQGFSFPLDATLVEKVVAARPFATPTDLNKVFGLEQKVESQIKDLLNVRSTHFWVYAEGDAHGVKKAVQAVVDRSAGEPVLRYWRLAD